MYKYDLVSKGIFLKVNVFFLFFYFRYVLFVNNFKFLVKSIFNNLKVIENWYL